MRSPPFQFHILILLPIGLWAASSSARAEAVINGTVQAKPECSNAPMEAWLSSGDTLLYQIEVPQHGSFEFHVNSGKYTLVVVGATGCLAERELEARENDTRTVTLVPAQATPPAATAPKHASRDWTSWLLNSAQASPDCPNCGPPSSGGAPGSFLPEQAPWYTGYGSMSYTNFNLPGPWLKEGRNVSAGIDGDAFPGEGRVFAIKPVLYINGPDGAPISIRARLPQSTHWLVAAPEHGSHAWNGTIEHNQFKSEDATYRYVYYDYRADHQRFQDTKGFCAGRGSLIPQLGGALKKLGFKQNEIADFARYWTFKIPQSERYCVYPQSTAELQQIAQLEISPKPAVFKQVLFIVQVGENLDGKGKFRRAPVATWKAEEADLPATTPRVPASAKAERGAIEVREWGVGFLESKHE